MLAVRRAYSLFFGDGWRGPFRALAWAGGALLGRPMDLETAELDLPVLADFLPPELFRAASTPLTNGGVDNQLYDVIVFPVFDFEFRYQRPQQIAAQFAARGHRVFWVSPTRTVLEPGAPYQVVPLRRRMLELRLRTAPQNLYGGGMQPGELEQALESLSSVYRDYGVATAISLVQFPYWRQFALGLRERFGTAMLYDRMDDWQNWTAEPAIGAFALGEERRIQSECDLLLVSSGEFEQQERNAGRTPLLARNATDFPFFAAGRSTGQLAEIPRPIIGYYGAIADWFDLDLVEQVARSRPDYSFVLIGHAYRSDMHKLQCLPNVHLTGEKPYRELPSYLRDFDVCLIPFLKCPLTRGVDPVKAYEYLSQGKPVVSVPLPELASCRDLMYLAETPAEFANAIDQALAESDLELVERRTRMASDNTWTHRVDAITTAVRKCYPLVSILILTHNSQEFLGLCLESIASETAYPNYEVVIVDNHSCDGTLSIAREFADADPRIHVHALEENRGFAAGNNDAARLSRGEYLLLLNPDTVVTSGWLHRLMRVLQTDAEAGIAAPVSNYSGNETKIDFDYTDRVSMQRFSRDLAARRAGEVSEISVAALFCGLLSRHLWNSVGGLDERYQVGMFEDDDFSLRVRRMGLKIVVAEDCLVHHFGGGSFLKLPVTDSARIFEENRRLFEEKWGITWTPHRLRPGVKKPHQDRRFTPREF